MLNYRVLSYPNLRGEKRITDDPRVGVISQTFPAENEEQIRRVVVKKFGFSQDVEIYTPEGAKLDF